MTWKACGELRCVTAKPEEMSSKVEAVGFALLLRLFDQLLAQFGFGYGFGRGDNQIALAAGGHAAGLGAAVAVGRAEAGDGQARHEEGFQHAILNELDALGFLAFVVVVVAAAEPGFAEGGEGGVVGDGEESWAGCPCRYLW